MDLSGQILLTRFSTVEEPRNDRVGIVDLKTNTLTDITGADIYNVKSGDYMIIKNLRQIFEWTDRLTKLRTIDIEDLNQDKYDLNDVILKAPIPKQMEVWAAGVTYEKSKKERTDESKGSDLYQKVYDSERPELFEKASSAVKVVPYGGNVGIREDSKWNVPEPELALIYNSKGERVGYTIGNDMSSRDIEGENALYLPQAKIYHRSCAIGPFVALSEGDDEDKVRGWDVQMKIKRAGKEEFSEETQVGKIKKSFQELKEYLFKSQQFKHGVALLTGTGIIPPEEFTLQDDDHIEISIGALGTLRNNVKTIPSELTNSASRQLANKDNKPGYLTS